MWPGAGLEVFSHTTALPLSLSTDDRIGAMDLPRQPLEYLAARYARGTPVIVMVPSPNNTAMG